MLPPEVQKLLVDCQNKRIPVFVSSSGLNIAFQTVIRRIEGQELILDNMVRPEFIRKFTSGDKFFLQCKMLRLQSTAVGPHGALMSFLIQDNSLLEETRQSERFMFAPEERVVAEVTNPFDRKTKVRRSVMDMSATGLSIRMNVPSKLFEPNAKLPDLRVIIDGKPYTKASAEVVYNRRFMDLNGKLRVQVGIKFTGAPRE